MFNSDKAILRKVRRQAKKVLALDDEMSAKSDAELQDMTVMFKTRLANGESLDDIKYEAFAVAREAAWRVLGQKPYEVQVMGGLIMNDGDIAEMHTGSGKTLTVTMPVYLNALKGEGVHVITVNEYLADRDAAGMGEIYRFLGLTVACNKRELSADQKREAFECDITYTVNSELGFDYLRDNMVKRPQDRVLRGLHTVFIDEIDSILIDDARTPLIISGQPRETLSLYVATDRFVKRLIAPVYERDKNGEKKLVSGDYDIDIKTRQVMLTPDGIKKAERWFKLDNLYDIDHTLLVHRINQALKANYIMSKGIEYIVKDDEILIVDQSTGRMMEGREFSEGLHQAIQAKEGVSIKDEHSTLATITYQNFFRLYDKLAGMTGTAKTEEEEFLSTYNMRVIPVPDHKPVIRDDQMDEVYLYKEDKYKAIVKAVADIHATGQPVLVGTPDVETSEVLDEMLTKTGLEHTTLNAKNHAREAAIIAQAGHENAITLATNMAGRGTDIKLTPRARALGGLAVLGVERNVSRRIDNQLRGRSGRQGDPGMSRFYVSLQDDLIKRFGGEKLAKMLDDGSPDAHEPLKSRALAKQITASQKKVENMNFDSRKNVLDYDDVLRRQREIMYAERDRILESENVHDRLPAIMEGLADQIVEEAKSDESLQEALSAYQLSIDCRLHSHRGREKLVKSIAQSLLASYEKNTETIRQQATDLEKQALLQTMDRNWIDHIDMMQKLKEGISLRSYAQNNPLQAYIQEGFELFKEMERRIDCQTATFLLSLRAITIQPDA